MKASLAVLGALAIGAGGCTSCSEGRDTPAPEADLRPEPPPTVPDETLEALEALGYVPTTPTDNPEARGVTTAATQDQEGLNLYSSRRRATALLVGLDGEVVHRWERDANELSEALRAKAWMHVEPLPDGSLLAITKDHLVSKHDWASNLVWRTRVPAHHDLETLPDGRLLVLVRDVDEIEHGGHRLPILADGIAVLTAAGEIERTVPLVPLFRRHVSESRLERVRSHLDDMPTSRLVRPGGVGDVLHANSIARLERDVGDIAPAGSVLLSFRAISRVAIVSADLDEILWTWGAGELDGQHDATQVASGEILLFDNGLRRERDSRVLQVSPIRREVTWRYAPADLFSRLRGGAQELPDGNVLITESDTGRALEVTREGEKVWEFWNPDVRGSGEDAVRGIIYRMNRFPRSFFEPLQNG